MVRANFHVNTDHRFADMPGGIEAVVTQTHAELIFTSCTKTAVALKAGGVLRTLKLLMNVNFGMNIEGNHCNSPQQLQANAVP
jgi:hypothetical protein